jgi:hypothetical protein
MGSIRRRQSLRDEHLTLLVLCMSKNMRKAKFLSRTPRQKSVKDADFEVFFRESTPTQTFLDIL